MNKSRVRIETNFFIYLFTLISILIPSLAKKNTSNLYKKISKFLHTKNILFTGMGRVAAYNIFKFLINKNKNEIILSPYTLKEIIFAIKYAGGKPIFVDIDIVTGLPKIRDVKKSINKRTAAILITHLYSDSNQITKFINKFSGKVKIIEDTAINFGASINKFRKLGTLADYGFFSLGTMKNFMAFNGGILFCKNKNDFKKIKLELINNKSYSYILAFKKIFLALCIDIFYNKYLFNFFTYYILLLFQKSNIKFHEKIIYPGLNYKKKKTLPSHYRYNFFEPFSYAALTNLGKINYELKNKISKVKYYQKNLKKNFIISKYKNFHSNAFLEYPILVNNKYELCKEFLNKGFDLRHTWYLNNSLKKKYPNSQFLEERLITLPTHVGFSNSDIKKISKKINLHQNSQLKKLV